MNGKQIELENATVSCITEEIEENEHHIFDNDLPYYSKQKSYDLEVSVGNITKKRFIKLLMAKGMQRNEAVEMARYVHRKYKNYNPMYLILI